MKLVRTSAGAVAAAIILTSAAGALACEPVWVRPVDVRGYTTVFLGRVESVNWLAGEVTVTPIKTIRGNPRRTRLRYNNVPFACGAQTFWVGERVYVFDADWVAHVDQVTFEPSVR